MFEQVLLFRLDTLLLIEDYAIWILHYEFANELIFKAALKTDLWKYLLLIVSF